MEGVGETGGGRGDKMPSHPKFCVWRDKHPSSLSLSRTGSLCVRIGKSFPGGPVSVASVFQLRTAVFGSFILFLFFFPPTITMLDHHYTNGGRISISRSLH